MANTSLNLANLDFDGIKSSLKTFMRAQPLFRDYDFEGSNMSVLIDLLAYNTYLNSFYLNMIASESFLDSAQLRNSVVSHAKELNYVPRSARSAKATIDLTFSANTNLVTIPKGTSFTTTIGYNLYTFRTAEESVHFSANNRFTVQNIDIYEGSISSDQFIVNYENTRQRFLLTDPNVDTRSIEVTVVEDNTGTVIEYTPASSTLGLGASSAVYFLQAAESGKYELIFGNGVIGRRPKDNSLVLVSYRVCNGTAGNGASRFVLDNQFTNFTSTPAVTVRDIARGGDAAETVESIKFNAPRYFQTQERAVNTSDYEIILQQRFPEIAAISAYGGEETIPAQYGKVFIAVDIADVEGLPDSKIKEYYDFLKPRTPLSIDPTFVSPEFLYYSVATVVKYDVNATNLNPEQVKSLVTNKIVTYNDTELGDFKASFRYSKFVSEIDSASPESILSNDTDIRVYKKVVPSIGENADIQVSFNVALTEEGAALGDSYDVGDLVAVKSSDFTYSGNRVHIEDDGAGKLRLIRTIGAINTVVIPDLGTVDYSGGSLQLLNFRVDGLLEGENHIKIYGVTAEKDFTTSQNVILDLEPSELDIAVISVRSGTGTQSRQRA